MNDQVVERVLSCTRLPTLPAVAVRVIELSSKADVSLREIADTIQNDQALSAKVLKTVNSSYYGLSRRCSTISQAMVALGLTTVKTVALGFSLIQAMGKGEEDEFDLEAYWRRCLLGATGASAAAEAAGLQEAEEVFLAGLLMDAGTLAMHRALGEEYGAIVHKADGAHTALADLERDALGIDHAEIGARLAETWRLPESLIEPIRCHDDPMLAEESHRKTAACVALGALAAEALMCPKDPQHLIAFRERAVEWLGLSLPAADELLGVIEKEAHAQASLFKVDLGQLPSAAELLAEAQERLAEMALDAQINTERLTAQNKSLQRQTELDPLTGIGNKRSLHLAAARRFTEASRDGKSLAVLFLDLDFFKQINDSYGHIAGDLVLKEASRRLKATLGDRGELFRFGGEEFAAIMPGVDLKKAEAVAEMLRTVLNSTPIDIRQAKSSKQHVRITTSVGVAAYDDSSRSMLREQEQLINAADQAVYAAKKAGRDCVRAFRFSAASISSPLAA
ncbi:MAG: sensor domain-containing diguanylate cyclase [Phycisphaerales bacterium]